LSSSLLVWTLAAEVKLPAVVSSHMVVQQGVPIRLWGKAAPGEQVTAKMAGKSASAAADANGQWRLALPKMKAGGPHTLAISGTNTITVEDVLVGEVWVASGQSNMEWRVTQSLNADQEKASATDSQIRFFRVKNTVAESPAEDVEAVWEVCSPQTAGEFSGVAYFFAREIRKARRAPVGVLQSDWGGTPAEAWTSRPALEAQPALRHFFADWEKDLAAYPERKAQHDRRLEKWKAEAAAAKAAGREMTRAPQAPRGPGSPWTPTGLYNAMIAPLTPYAIKGAIWYQGEANAGSTERSREYKLLFRTMIEDWRRAWGLGDFPFLFVQLAGFTAGQEADWPLVRESQTATLSLRNTGMAVAIDIGEEKDIHPKNKQEAGRRLALAAQAVAYKQKVESSGPLYQSMQRKGDAVELRFAHAKGLKAKDGELKSFLIAGADKKFVPAEARIQGAKVVVRSDAVKEPAAVRYGWADWTPANLYNGAGLPASPFRTDDWPETR
jgi:sialate O-acetylesterase